MVRTLDPAGFLNSTRATPFEVTWDGLDDAREAVPPGLYSVEFELASTAGIVGAASEPVAIVPSFSATTGVLGGVVARSRHDLSEGAGFEFVSTTSPTLPAMVLEGVVTNESSQEVRRVPAQGGAWDWDGRDGSGVVVPAGVYWASLDVFTPSGSLLASSPPASVNVVSIQVSTPSRSLGPQDPPLRACANVDDDNFDGQSDALGSGEDDELVALEVQVTPQVGGVLSIVPGYDPERLAFWPTAGRASSFTGLDLAAAPQPWSFWLEARQAGEEEFQVTIALPGQSALQAAPIEVSAAAVELVEYNTDEYRVMPDDLARPFVEIGLWENGHDANDNVELAFQNSFADFDSRNFRVRVTDPAAAASGQAHVLMSTWRMDGQPHDPPHAVTLAEDEGNPSASPPVAPIPGLFGSGAQLAVSPDRPTFPDDQLSFVLPDGSLLDDEDVDDPTHAVPAFGHLEVAYEAATECQGVLRTPVCSRDSADSLRLLRIRPFTLLEPFEDAPFDQDNDPSTPPTNLPYDHDCDPSTPPQAPLVGVFDYIDVNCNGAHDLGEPSERYYDRRAAALDEGAVAGENQPAGPFNGWSAALSGPGRHEDEAFLDIGVDHDGDPMTARVNDNPGEFDFDDLNGNGFHEPGEPSEPYWNWEPPAWGDLLPGEDLEQSGSFGALTGAAEFEAQLADAQVAWAQACVIVQSIAPLQVLDSPALRAALLDQTIDDQTGTDPDWNALNDAMIQEVPVEELGLVYVGALTGALGAAKIPWQYLNSAGQDGKTWVALESGAGGRTTTLEHEIGHALTNQGHVPDRPPWEFFPEEFPAHFSLAPRLGRRLAAPAGPLNPDGWNTVEVATTQRPVGAFSAPGNRLLQPVGP